ncbi:anti-sigma factor family protein [Paenibacillus marinisediminis]
MELIQRQLDHDLDQSEHSLLTEHLHSCSACAEMFERLKMLNDGLEQLPKVMPKVSLVDAILPQLNEIDRLNALKSSADGSAKQDASADVTELKPNSNTQTNVKQFPAKEDERPVVRNRWFDRINWRTSSAVVAAGLVFGLFMVNYEGARVQESADFAELKSENQQSKQDSRMMDTRSSQAEQLETNSAKQEKTVEPQKTFDETPVAATAEAEEGQSTGGSEPEGKRSIAPEQEDKNDAKTSTPGSNKKSDDLPSAKVSNEPRAQFQKEQLNEKDPIKVEDQAGDSVNSLSGQGTKEVKTVDEQNPGSVDKGIAFMNHVTAFSPDHAYEVIWKDHVLTLNSVNGNKIATIQSMPWADEPIEFIWSEDSSFIVVVTTDKDGNRVETTFEVSSEGLTQTSDQTVASSK